jgi:hypothetical protein
MRVVNIAGYNTNDPSNLPTGTDDRVLSSASDTQMT